MASKKDDPIEDTERPVEDAEVQPVEEPEPPAEVVLDPDQHFFIEDETAPRVFPAGDVRSRRLTVDGRNVEHVHDHESGCWVYRQM